MYACILYLVTATSSLVMLTANSTSGTGKQQNYTANSRRMMMYALEYYGIHMKHLKWLLLDGMD